MHQRNLDTLTDIFTEIDFAIIENIYMGDGQKNIVETKKLIEFLFAVNEPTRVQEQVPLMWDPVQDEEEELRKVLELSMMEAAQLKKVEVCESP